jgi:hypothetical protein
MIVIQGNYCLWVGKMSLVHGKYQILNAFGMLFINNKRKIYSWGYKFVGKGDP